ncbi:hypothetical protein HK100_004141, partial [Physocladia obscura]
MYGLQQPLLQKCLDIQVKIYGTHEHVDVAMTLNSLGLLAMEQGKYDDAQKYLDESHAIYINAHGSENHPDIEQVQGDLMELKLRIEQSLVPSTHGNISNVADMEGGRNETELKVEQVDQVEQLEQLEKVEKLENERENTGRFAGADAGSQNNVPAKKKGFKWN